MAGVFQEQGLVLMGKIRSAVGSKDWPAMRREAHSLKGSSLNLGAMKLAEAAVKLEQGAFDDSPSLKQSLVYLESAWSETTLALKAFSP